MRVIDEDLELPFGWNRLEPPGDLRRTAETENRFAETDPHAAGRGERGHGIRHVKSSDERNAHQITFAARVELIGSAGKFSVVIRGAKIRVHAHPVSDDRDFLFEPIDQLDAVTIVDVDHSRWVRLRLLLGQSGEECGLRLKVVLHRPVKIQVVLR